MSCYYSKSKTSKIQVIVTYENMPGISHIYTKKKPTRKSVFELMQRVKEFKEKWL